MKRIFISRLLSKKKNKQCLFLFMIILILSLSLIDFSIKSFFHSIGNGLGDLMIWANDIVDKPKGTDDNLLFSVEEMLTSGTILHFKKLDINGIRINKNKQKVIEKSLDIYFDKGYKNAYEYGRETGNEGILTTAGVSRMIKLDKVNHNTLAQNYYIVDVSTKIDSNILNPKKLYNYDFSVDDTEAIKILIYHTHASEAFKDSRKGKTEDTVVGAGDYLAELLTDYGYNVIHDKTAYDRIDGLDNRNKAYTTARPAIENILSEHPDIDVIIDLHRDSGTKRVTDINDVKMAKIMFFNGLCRNTDGEIDYLENNNLEANLAFSLRMKMTGDVMYPGLFHKIYLKNYRYNMHFCEKYLLVELGTENNTVEEAFNSMPPLADVLDTVLSGKTELN